MIASPEVLVRTAPLYERVRRVIPEIEWTVFAADVERAKKVAAKIEAGMVFINSYSYTGPETPFGGVKNSG